MIQVKEMMQDNDLKNSKSKDKGSRSRSQSMNDQSHYKQDKTKTRQSINVKSHILQRHRWLKAQEKPCPAQVRKPTCHSWLKGINRTLSTHGEGPTVTIKAKIDVVKEIREALTPTQVEIFEKTCFGHWLHVGLKKNNQPLIHTLLTCMVDGKANELSFLVLENLTDNPFRNRMFPHIEAKVLVKLSDVIDIFYKMRKRSLALEDNDAVRICLLVLLQQGFLGHQLSHNVSDDMLKLVFHDAKREKGEKIQYMMTGFVWSFMIWTLEAIPTTHRYVNKQPTEKIPRALAWELRIPFSWSRCCTLFVYDQLAPPLEILTPTKVESETDWWKASLEYFEGKHVQSEVVRKPLEIEKDGIITKLEGTVATLTETVSSLHGTIGTLESRLLALEGDARVSTLTQTVSSLQGTIGTLESRLVALEGDERDFGVVSDGDIAAYMSPGPSYTSPASTAQKSLPLAHRRKLRVRRTPLKLKSPMRCYSRKMRCTIPPPASTTMAHVSTISVPMTTTKVLKDTKDAAKDVAKDAAKDIHIDASDSAALKSFCKEDELQFIGLEKGDKPDYRYDHIGTHDDYRGLICEPSFWDVLYPGGEKAEYLEEGKLDGLRMRLSMESVVDALRATSHGTNQSTVYGTLDCGVMTCKFLEMLTKGKTIDIKSFGDNVGLKCQEYRAKMALMLYETRCERAV
ncbi:hypothetical protein Tco_1074447 [Tanacetum coccineum]